MGQSVYEVYPRFVGVSDIRTRTRCITYLCVKIKCLYCFYLTRDVCRVKGRQCAQIYFKMLKEKENSMEVQS